jgi:hypothetical protein
LKSSEGWVSRNHGVAARSSVWEIFAAALPRPDAGKFAIVELRLLGLASWEPHLDPPFLSITRVLELFQDGHRALQACYALSDHYDGVYGMISL